MRNVKRYFQLIQILILMMCGCVRNPRIINAPHKLIEIQIMDDYRFIKTIFESFPHERLKPLEINFTNQDQALLTREGTNHKDTKKYFIETSNSRGIWVHELVHYFSQHLTNPITDEFPCEVLENYINGVSSKSYKKYFEYRPIKK